MSRRHRAEKRVINPDPKFGEEVLACVRLRDAGRPPSPGEFRTLCKGKIAHFKIPRYWKVVEDFPMTVTGKVQKFMMRDIMAKELEEEGSVAS